MQHKSLSLSLLVLLFSLRSHEQQLVYADFEHQDFFRLGFEIIGEFQDRILVYKAKLSSSYFLSRPSQTNLGYVSERETNSANQVERAPIIPVQKSRICIYDQRMKLIKEKDLPLPAEITGVHFLLYTDYFYMFYQYLEKRTVYSMAVRFDIEGNIMGSPVCMDTTVHFKEDQYQNQIYTVINSEDKKHIELFKMAYFTDSGYVLTCLDFDQNLQEMHHFHGTIKEPDRLLLNFNEYQVDNEGNLLFLGVKVTPFEFGEEEEDYFFKLRNGDQGISCRHLQSPNIYKECPRLLIDNRNKKYFLTSFYSKKERGYIEGMHVMQLDAQTDSLLYTSTLLLEDSLRSKTGTNNEMAFDDFYISHLFLKKDGGLVLVCSELYSPYKENIYTRWDYMQHFREKLDYDFLYYDPYSFDHYFPWRQWRHFYDDRATIFASYESSNTLFISLKSNGGLEWANLMKTEQSDQQYLNIGSKPIIANGVIYLIYNKYIKGHKYLIAETISPSGQIDEDKKAREDMEIANSSKEFEYFPIFAKQISARSIVLPCKKGGDVAMVKVEF